MPKSAITEDKMEKTVYPAASKVRKSKRIASKKDETNPRAAPKPGAVVYIGHIPHGFYESQMRGFFEQFGVVTRVRLSRSKKTAKSKHFAFIEFKHPEVASIAAESMNNYLMLGKILKAHVMPVDKLHEKMFVGANRNFVKVPRAKVEREKREKERTVSQESTRLKKLSGRDAERRRKIEAAGMEYEFEGYAKPGSGLRPKHTKL